MRYAIKRPEGTYVGTNNYAAHENLEQAQLYHRRGDALRRVKDMQNPWRGAQDAGLRVVGVELREVEIGD